MLSSEGMPWNAYATELQNQGQHEQLVARVSVAVAATTLIAGVVLLLWDHWHVDDGGSVASSVGGSEKPR